MTSRPDVVTTTTTTTTKPSMVKFIVQSIFGLIVLTFAALQISLNQGEPNQIWVGLICAIAGIFFPHPTPYGGGGGGGGDDDDLQESVGPGRVRQGSSTSSRVPTTTTTTVETPRFRPRSIVDVKI